VDAATLCRLEAGDTADWKSALRLAEFDKRLKPWGKLFSADFHLAEARC
jgi:hypothetical protein